jgi:hypothetical protein
LASIVLVDLGLNWHELTTRNTSVNQEQCLAR